jgi:hypothetical protein
LTWTGTAPQYDIFRSIGNLPRVKVGTTTATSFTDSDGLVPGGNYLYFIAANYGGGMTAEAETDAGPEALVIIPDPGYVDSSIPNPASPDIGGYVTIKAFTNYLGPLTGTQLYVAWADGTVSRITAQAADFGTYATGDPATRGITAKHLYTHTGEFVPVMYITPAPGDQQEADFGVVFAKQIPTIVTPAHIVSHTATTATFTVGAVGSGGDAV